MDTANITHPVLTYAPRWIIAVFEIPRTFDGHPIIDVIWQVFKPRRRLIGGWRYKAVKTGQVVTVREGYMDDLDEVRREMVGQATNYVPFNVPIQIAFGFFDFAKVSEWELLRAGAR